LLRQRHNAAPWKYTCSLRSNLSLRPLGYGLWWLTVLVTQVCTEFNVVICMVLHCSEVMSFSNVLSDTKILTSIIIIDFSLLADNYQQW